MLTIDYMYPFFSTFTRKKKHISYKLCVAPHTAPDWRGVGGRGREGCAYAPHTAPDWKGFLLTSDDHR